MLADGGAAEDVPALQDERFQARAAEVGRRGQPIVATPNDDRVVFHRHAGEYTGRQIDHFALDNRSRQVQISPQARPRAKHVQGG